jgi:hypothetical protein
MPSPAKPCEGRFSEEVLAVLKTNKDRAQWANHTCEVCGLAVGAALVQGKWVPEQHWPSVKYQPRNGAEKKRENSAVEILASDESITLAESSPR